ncbi:MAG TPA: BTAD domain-containing putative transcriptional regulator [Hyphomicrobiaceae bacterium]|nr:BTAD domain-containing putative transcriptional regulator [Hyphomicrobiaceae bacterium]
MLGNFRVSRDGRDVTLPASRKVRALLAYLALAPRGVTRGRLCELLWEVPNDPRGELRWCLSKLRGILDEPDRKRVQTRGNAIGLDLSDCFVDAVEIGRLTQEGIQTIEPDRLKEASEYFAGDFLEGLEIERSPQFSTWLVAQRHRFRACHTALLEHLAESVSGEEALGYLEKWAQFAPFDRRAHEVLLNALGRSGRIREGEEHLAATARLFEAEGLDSKPISDAWRAARTGAGAAASPAIATTPLPPAGAVETTAAAPRRASIAVMPFVDRTTNRDASDRTASGLTRDVITRLAKMRSAFVIAYATVQALHERAMSPEEAGRTLNVDYVVSGALLRQGNRLMVAVELIETRTARIIWAETFDNKLDEALQVLDEVGNRIVALIASEVETIERNRAILRPPNSLDAWAAHHRGLWHMYRFDRENNQHAQHYFELAVRLDPTFARAYAGLSFTHFQNAFQGWTEREKEVDEAFAAAGQSLMIDDHDPAAHWAMGRALWLRGTQEKSLSELERAVDLSPNFALGHYTLAFIHSQSGDPHAAIRYADHSRHLSPFDPLLFGMLGTRAMAHIRLGQFEEAAEWAVRASARPNAHAHISGIAAYCLALAGRLEEARVLMASIRKTIPNYGIEDFLAAFRFAPDGVALWCKAAKLID